MDGHVRISEFHYWSPTEGRDIVRLSLFNDRGHEFWAEIEDREGREYRHARDAVLQALYDAAMAGQDPGQVTIESEHGTRPGQA